MSQIAGVSTKDGDVADKLGVMLEAFHPQATVKTNPPSKVSQWSVSSIVEDIGRNRALLEVPLPIDGRTPERPHLDHESNLILIFDGEFYNSQEVVPKLSQNQYTAAKSNTELAAYLLQEVPGSLEERVRKVLKELDGDYALAVGDAKQVVICRNPLGTKPLYFAEDERFSAFASNKKPLWKIGLSNVMPLRAGELAIFDHERVSIKEALPLDKGEIQIEDITQAVDCYQEVLCSAVRKRLDEVSQVNKVGVLLSGGVDSCLLAKLVYDIASDLGIEVIAYTAGLPDSPDVSFAREFAEEIGIEHKTRLLNTDKVGEYVPKVIEAIEEADFVQVEAGIGSYAALDMASQDGIRVFFSGQGPDELWGGYTWYPEVLGRDGRQELSRRMWDDFTRADIETLDRENKIAMAHGAEMMFPYLDTEVVNLARSVASGLKVTSEEDRLGKHPHRQLAMRMGIPDKYANRKKVAAQHGTGIHSVLDEVARKEGFNPDVVREIAYSSDQVTAIKLGSSERYGYRYAGKKLWQVPQHVQLFLHTLAYSKGLLNKSVRDRIGYFLGEVEHSP